MTRPVAHLGPHRGHLLVDDRAPSSSSARSRRGRAGTARSTAMPCGVCTTSGCHCTPQILRSAYSIAATGASGVEAVATNPSGTLGDRVEVAHPHVLLGGHAVASSVRLDRRSRVTCARPYSPRMPRPTVPPSCWAMSCTP